MSTADPHDPRPSGQVQAQLAGLWRGFRVTITIQTDIRRLDPAIAFLSEQGLQAPPEPVLWQTTPDGLPICPKHGVPMRLREKQGDTWHSHCVLTTAGEELYCKGYPGSDSPGWFADPGETPPPRLAREESTPPRRHSVGERR